MAGRPRPLRTVGLRLRVKSDGLHLPWTIRPPEGCRPRAGERGASAMPSGARGTDGRPDGPTDRPPEDSNFMVFSYVVRISQPSGISCDVLSARTFGSRVAGVQRDINLVVKSIAEIPSEATRLAAVS